jgi:hypothetical protein
MAQKKTSDATTWLIIVVAAAAIVGILALALIVLAAIVHAISHAYNLIYLPAVPSGTFWGFFCVYIALVFFEITLLDKFALIESSTGWLIAVLAGLTSVVAPLAWLFRSSHSVVANCGSWASPSPYTQSPFGKLLGECSSLADGNSRSALIAGVIGLLWPLVLMTLQALGEYSRKKSKVSR